MKFGRYKVICLGVLICGIAHAVLVVGSIPSVLQAGHAVAPFIIGLIVLAFGAGRLLLDEAIKFSLLILHTGLFKSNLFPVILDQDTQKGLILKTLPSGERVNPRPRNHSPTSRLSILWSRQRRCLLWPCNYLL